MEVGRGVTAAALAVGLAAVGLLAWPVDADVGGRVTACGPAAPWIVHIGYDPRGSRDPKGLYDEFHACRVAAVPRAAAGWLITAAASAALGVRLKTTSVRQHGDRRRR